ncbi:hypothetical protein KU306_09780 [Haloferax larsenii]|uniref:TIGR04206 family protein n=1 Tax=Haloferax larsenii TaxID=302484 RepID=A0ABY5RCB7_HALLR|nr:hypothetical protein [Haloferax larsenii]UVE49215.1 hypothetical protein KU306_09780 [Haloferax larsenii]
MVWVRSEHAGALSVVATWLCALLPWNLMYSPNIADGSLLFVRFPFFQVRFAWGIDVAQRIALSDPLSAVAFQAGQPIAVGYKAWSVGAAVMAIAVLFSVVYYTQEERVEDGPVDPVRVLGGLLGLAGVVLAASTYLLATRGFPGIPVPLGVVLLFVFAGVLLTVERA